MQIKYRVDPETNLTVPYTPEGRFIHVPPRDPTTTWRHRETPWWKDSQYVIGNITKKERKLRIVNTLTSKEDILEVGCEETLEEIRDRFYQFNAHAASYTWKVSSTQRIGDRESPTSHTSFLFPPHRPY